MIEESFLRLISTKHIIADIRKCRGCWACIEACPRNVIGKVGAFWHRHIVIKNPEDCIGCMKCRKACAHGVFSKNTEDGLE